METADLEAERRRERDLREKAKRAMRDRGDDRGERELRAAREERGTQAEPQGREGDWGPPPPWWIQQQQEKKQRKKAAQRRRELERKAVAHPLCGGGHGDPLAQQQRASAEACGRGGGADPDSKGNGGGANPGGRCAGGGVLQVRQTWTLPIQVHFQATMCAVQGGGPCLRCLPFAWQGG